MPLYYHLVHSRHYQRSWTLDFTWQLSANRMPFVRCKVRCTTSLIHAQDLSWCHQFYTESGDPVREGCHRKGAGCNFIHPDDPNWANAPEPSFRARDKGGDAVCGLSPLTTHVLIWRTGQASGPRQTRYSPSLATGIEYERDWHGERMGHGRRMGWRRMGYGRDCHHTGIGPVKGPIYLEYLLFRE